jgi:hypothetical protein
MKKMTWFATMTVWLATFCGYAADPQPLGDQRFQEQVKGIKAEPGAAERLRRAKDLCSRHPLSSLQVKAIALTLPDDGLRLEFATAAYPHTVDPENFYEVYDAFTAFSKVMRLHDRVREFSRPPAGPVVRLPEVVSEAELKDILQAIRNESFEQTRDKVARQIVNSSRKKFLSAQVKRLLECFDFENTKLEFAKFAFDFTQDPERYFLVNEAFTFAGSKEALSRHIASRTQTPERP